VGDACKGVLASSELANEVINAVKLNAILANSEAVLLNEKTIWENMKHAKAHKVRGPVLH
jgi:hypothetical protein